MAMPSFNIGSKYSFEVYPAALLPSDYTNVTVLGTLSESLARKFIPTREMHANFYPYLPPSTPNDAAAYTYLHIQMQNGVETVIGLAWIKPDSVKSTSWSTIVATIQTSDPDAVNKIRNALVSNNFNQITLEVASS